MKPISINEQRVLDVLIFEKLIPTVPFDIEEHHLVAYMHAYVSVMKTGKCVIDTSNYRYARKLAGLTLLKANISFGASVSNIKAGLVYLIENPSYIEHYKIGMTIDIDSRLSSYQTYDPFRKFKIAHYDFVLNRRVVESNILSSYHISLEEGEWALKENCLYVFMKATNNYDKIMVNGVPKNKNKVAKRFLNKRELEELNELRI